MVANLATELNLELQNLLDRELWLDLLVADLRRESLSEHWTDRRKRKARLEHFAQRFYRAIAPTGPELEAAISAAPETIGLPARWPPA